MPKSNGRPKNRKPKRFYKITLYKIHNITTYPFDKSGRVHHEKIVLIDRESGQIAGELL